MGNKIDRRDLDDLSIVDAEELQSSGSGDVYRSGVVVLSSTGSTGQVRISGWDTVHGDDDDFLQVGDVFILSGSIPVQPSASFRIVSIIDSGTFTVSPSILTSVFGTGTFKNPPGAERIGYDPTNLGISSSVTPTLAGQAKESMFQQLLSWDPAGFNARETFTRTGNKVNQEAWRRTADSTLLKTIDYVYSGNNVTSEVAKVYAEDGATVVAQKTLLYTYQGSTVTAITGTRDI